MADIFISYKREERARILPLAQAMERDGYTVWWDLDLVSGERWAARIKSELDAAKVVIVMWTAASVTAERTYASEWIENEANEAARQNKLFPVLLDDGRIPWTHQQKQCADLVGWRGDVAHPGYRRMLEGVERLAGKRSAPASPEVEAWISAERTQTAEAYRGFRATYPHSRFSILAKARALELDEAAAWATLGAAPSEVELKMFLQEYQDGRFAEEAKKRLAKLKPPGFKLSPSQLVAWIGVPTAVLTLLVTVDTVRNTFFSPRPDEAVAAPEEAGNPALAAIEAISSGDWSAALGRTLLARVLETSSREDLERLAAAGVARAQVLAGLGQDFGIQGFSKNEGKAVDLYRLAAEQEDARGQVYLGAMYANGLGGLAKNDPEALRLFQLAAAQGNATGQAYLGYMYELGLGGLAEDGAEAVQLYRLAAAQGNATGQAYLGFMHQSGRGGLTVDEAEAVRLYRLAAAQGNAGGQVKLGVMHVYGLGGLPKDEAEAVRLFRLSAGQGDAGGQTYLGYMYANGLGGLAKDEAEAVRLYRLAAQQGFPAGAVALSDMYLKGLGGLPKDDRESERLIGLAFSGSNVFEYAQLHRLGQ